MKATFDVSGDRSDFYTPTYAIAIQFNGVPGKVVLSIDRTTRTRRDDRTPDDISAENVVYAVLESSHARAISSALLSAATEARQ